MTSVQILNTSTELNFEINHSDSPLQEYKILMDFLETFAVGDIFEFIVNPTYVTLSISASGTGTITPSGSVNVIEGRNLTLTISPSGNVYLDDVDQGVFTRYILEDVDEEHEIYVSIIKKYLMSISSTGTGSLSPSGDIEILEGEDLTFTISPSGNVILDGEDQGVFTEYTLENIREEHTIEVNIIRYYNVNLSATGTGTISPSGNVEVLEGEDLVITISPSGNVYIDDVDQGVYAEYTLENVDSDHTISIQLVEPEAGPFIFTVTTPDTFTLPLVEAGEYDFTVDWGDDTSDTITAWNDAKKTHTYETSGAYDVEISGTIKGWSFYVAGGTYGDWDSCERITEIKQWGCFSFANTDGAFEYCWKMTISATDVPDLSDATSLKRAFEYCEAVSTIPNINSWDVSTITDMSYMFNYCPILEIDISSWDVSTVEDMQWMFYSCEAFNSDIGEWNVSKVTNMTYMFGGCHVFNQDISSWVVSNVTNMSYMFNNAAVFDQPIGSWNVSSVEDMRSMFYGANVFNQDIGSWNTSKVTDMRSMFSYAALFNQNISSWDTSNVTGAGMNGMFYRATSFNQPIGTWNTSKVTNMSMMFAIANSFNQDLSGWDVSKVTTMDSMFTYEYGSQLEIFNQDLSSWNVASLTSAQGFCKSFSKANYDALLIGWTGWSGGAPTKTVQSGTKLGVFSTKYTLGGDAAAARTYLATTKSWQITDGGGE